MPARMPPGWFYFELPAALDRRTGTTVRSNILHLSILFMQNSNSNHVDIPFPGNPLVRVNDASDSYYPYVCYLQLTYEDGSTATGTGTLFAGRYVLTAGHNVYDKNSGNAVKVLVTPGLNADPGSFKQYPMQRFFVPDEYKVQPVTRPEKETVTDHAAFLYDYAVVDLGTTDLKGGPLSIMILGSDQIQNKPGIITGYPSGKPDGTMWTSQGPLKLQAGDEAFIYYQLSTAPGDSGAAIVLQGENNSFDVCGIHVAGYSAGNTNFGVRITQKVYEQLTKWTKP
jgi:glutamyl endopeptidase